MLKTYFVRLRRHWCVLMFGAFSGSISFYLWITNKSRPTLWGFLGIFVIALLVAGYFTWRDEYVEVEGLKKRLDSEGPFIELLVNFRSDFNTQGANVFQFRNFGEAPATDVRLVDFYSGKEKDLLFMPVSSIIPHDKISPETQARAYHGLPFRGDDSVFRYLIQKYEERYGIEQLVGDFDAPVFIEYYSANKLVKYRSSCIVIVHRSIERFILTSRYERREIILDPNAI
jgi:hypothetical protein